MIRVEITNNCTGTQELGNYDYEIYLPGKTYKGTYKNFPRQRGWVALVHAIAQAAAAQEYYRLLELMQNVKNLPEDQNNERPRVD